jgi:protein TonB
MKRVKDVTGSDVPIARKTGPLAWILQRLFVLVCAASLTLALFLVLPLMQTISTPPARDLIVQNLDFGELEPPPPPPPEEEEQEEQPPDKPPEFVEQSVPLELGQLELALNPGMGDGFGGDFAINLAGQLGEGDGEEIDRIFSLDELDQRPSVIFQRVPTYPPELRKQRREGTVYVVFLVDTRGRVVSPRVEKSTDPAFERAALEAVKQWRFEPGTRRGEKVQFKMRIPITFNAA